MTSKLDPRFLVSGELEEILDLLDGFVAEKCLGRNDMCLIQAHILSALALVAAHCARTRDDYDETVAMVRQFFDTTAELYGDTVKK
jgi:hypothetical protein